MEIKTNRTTAHIVSDNLYSSEYILSNLSKLITVHPLFQRLGRLRQLGLLGYIHPAARHTRFSHSIGTAKLAHAAILALASRQPELEITSDESLAVETAGLCHDLGHGPLSHEFEILYAREAPDIHHEMVSVALMRYICDSMGMERPFVDTVAWMIAPDRIPRPAHIPASRAWLADFVNNINHGIDIDKMDYVLRDWEILSGPSMGGADIGRFRDQIFAMVRRYRVVSEGRETTLAGQNGSAMFNSVGVPLTTTAMTYIRPVAPAPPSLQRNVLAFDIADADVVKAVSFARQTLHERFYSEPMVMIRKYELAKAFAMKRNDGDPTNRDMIDIVRSILAYGNDSSINIDNAISIWISMDDEYLLNLLEPFIPMYAYICITRPLSSAAHESQHDAVEKEKNVTESEGEHAPVALPWMTRYLPYDAMMALPCSEKIEIIKWDLYVQRHAPHRALPKVEFHDRSLSLFTLPKKSFAHPTYATEYGIVTVCMRGGVASSTAKSDIIP